MLKQLFFGLVLGLVVAFANAEASPVNAKNPYSQFRSDCGEGQVPTGCSAVASPAKRPNLRQDGFQLHQVGSLCRPAEEVERGQVGRQAVKQGPSYQAMRAAQLCHANRRFCGSGMMQLENCCGVQCVHMAEGNTDPNVVGTCIQRCAALGE